MLQLQPTLTSSSNLALTNDDDDCEIVAVSSPAAASAVRPGGGKRKHEDSEPANDDDANPTNQCFFRISHTQLGRHKLFEKGAVATHDLALQFIRTLRIENSGGDGDGDGDNISVILDMNVKDHASSTRLATFMSEAGVTFDELRKHWRVWKLANDSSIWNLDAIELEKYFPGHDVAEHKQVLSSIIGAGALHGNSVHSGDMYIAGDDEQQCIDQLLAAGLIVGSSAGYRPLGEAK